MGKKRCIELLGNSPTAKMWFKFYKTNGDFESFFSDIAKNCGISRMSLYKVFPTFVKNRWMIPSKIDRGVQKYKVNKAHIVVKSIIAAIDNHIRNS